MSSLKMQWRVLQFLVLSVEVKSCVLVCPLESHLVSPSDMYILLMFRVCSLQNLPPCEFIYLSTCLRKNFNSMWKETELCCFIIHVQSYFQYFRNKLFTRSFHLNLYFWTPNMTSPLIKLHTTVKGRKHNFSKSSCVPYHSYDLRH